jgi:hypothetical protein
MPISFKIDIHSNERSPPVEDEAAIDAEKWLVDNANQFQD